jgi:hypothetical protein
MSTIIGNAQIKIPGNSTATITLPDGGLKPAAWSDVSGDEFPAAKAQLFTKAFTNFDLAIGTTPPVAREEVVFVAQSAGEINRFAALLVDTGTSTDIDFVLKKNGSTLMSADLTITHGTSDRVVVEGTLSSTAFVSGDVFSIQLVVNSGTGAAGPLAFCEFIEVLT